MVEKIISLLFIGYKKGYIEEILAFFLFLQIHCFFIESEAIIISYLKLL